MAYVSLKIVDSAHVVCVSHHIVDFQRKTMMIDISEFEDRTSIAHAALRILQENGVSVPKPVKMVASRSKETGKEKSKIFGVALADIEERDDVLLDDHIACDVPHFLAECLSYLEEYVTVEGLFRKAGSVARQKDIKVVCVCVCV